MSAEELPNISIAERSLLAQAIVELDAARGNFFVSCDRYADFPSDLRSSATLRNGEGVTQAYGSVVGTIFAEDIDVENAANMSIRLLLEENRQRYDMLQSIYPEAGFQPAESTVTELRNRLVKTVTNSEDDVYDDGTEDDDMLFPIKRGLTNIYSEFLTNDMNNFYRYTEKTSRYHLVRTGRFIDKYARRGAMFGATLAVGAYLGRTF